MGKVVVPITKLTYNPDATFPLEALGILQGHPGYQSQEDYTFTFRFSLPPEDELPGERERLKDALTSLLPPNKAHRLIEILEANNWDVSFFVDTF